MPATLVVHRGGWEATKADLAAVPVPDSTESYHPVPYGRFIEEVELHVPRFGLTVQSSAFALAREGGQMFGVLTCANGKPSDDYALAIGVRNSYDRSLSVGLTLGSRVFCCDNLAFSGEVTMHRKHTVNVFRDLPDLIYKMLSTVSVMKDRMGAEIGQMKETRLSDETAHHLMVRAIRAGAIPSSRLPKVIEYWDNMRPENFGDRTAWSLFNSFTAVSGQQAPRLQMDNTLRLSKVFREVLR